MVRKSPLLRLCLRTLRYGFMIVGVTGTILAFAPTIVEAEQPDRIIAPLNSSNLVRLTGNVPPATRTAIDLGRVSGGTRMEQMKLVFRLTAAQQTELDRLLERQQDPSSPDYHKWLSPEEYGERFGLSRGDVAKVTDWLRSQGFEIVDAARSRTYVAFNGTAAQVSAAFHTEIHWYMVKGKRHYANATEPSIPAALAPAVSGVSSLHNFGLKPLVTSSVTGNHFMQPGDFATIYDVNVLYANGLDGSGQTIAVLGQTDLVTDFNGNFTDVIAFRTNSGLGLPPKLTAVLVPGEGDPGISSDDIVEANLDVEWAGGVAKNAQLLFVIGNPFTGNGVIDALTYAVTSNLAPVISMSYGGCEAAWDSTSIQLMINTGKQANAQGQTLLFPSGDSGAADCDSGSSATNGLAVDFPASMPYATSVGGSEFTGDPPNPNSPCTATQYWGGGACLLQDTSATALSYIPEMVWNDTAQNNSLTGGGGGISSLFTVPPWQVRLSSLTQGMRGVPDLSLSASAAHDGYLVCSQGSCVCGFRNACTSTGTFFPVGGTSASTPSFAGILALINQHTGVSQGNINARLYLLADAIPSAFHDIQLGDNIVPCYPGTKDCPSHPPYQFGYTAGPGYDVASGLGSVDASVLAAVWNAVTPVTLSVAIAGSGTVNSSDGFIKCGQVCALTYQLGSVATLTAIESSGWVFEGWGGCDQPLGNVCTVTLYGSRTVTAAFSALYPLSVSLSGSGTVTSGDGHINCGALCSFSYKAGSVVALTATPTNGWTFTGWSGCDTAHGNTCIATTNNLRSVSASFTATQGTSKLTVATSGIGNVTSNDGQINCAPYCSGNYANGTWVTLTAVAGWGANFAGWSGCDQTQSNVCSVSVGSAKNVTATFGGIGAGLQFVPVTPCRVADTRWPPGPFGGPALPATTERAFPIPFSNCGIPSTAVAYSLNVTVVPPGALGYLTIWPTGQDQPLVSTLNSYDGRVKANAAIVPAGASGDISLYASDTTNVILDINGYFIPAATGTLAFYPLQPCRVVDTRNPNGPLGGPYINGNTSREFPVRGNCKLPQNAQAYSMNFTAVPHGPLGYLTVWPSDQQQPYVSTLNAYSGAATANAAVVPSANNGDISVFVSNDSDVVIDVNGYFAPLAQNGLSLYPVTPCRVIDTRNTPGLFFEELTADIAGSPCRPPFTAQAYVLNATVVPPGPLGFLSLWPDGQAQPLVSTLNAYDGAVTSNMAIVPTANGLVDSFATDLTNLLLDISSYFAP